MRLLLDECVPGRLRKALPLHEVSTVVQAGWSGVRNGKLLALASAKFDAFITVDKNLPYQQNQAKLPISILVLNSYSNELVSLLPFIPALERCLLDLVSGSYVLVKTEA